MRSKQTFLLIVILAVLFSENLGAIVKIATPILSPTAEEPIIVEQGNTISVLVRMRLPLTPPPGVQQPSAKTGWDASLVRRDAIAHNQEPSTLSYAATVIRYRPENKDVYRVTVKTNPWTPPGKYDLVLKAPGLEASARKSVWIGNIKKDERNELVTRKEGTSTLSALNPTSQKAMWRITLIVPKGIPGFEVKVDDAPLEPSFVSLAGDTPEGEVGSRALYYEIEVPASSLGNPGKRTATWQAVEQKKCSPSIEIVGNETEIDPTVKTPLTFVDNDFGSAFVFWDFGDGVKDNGKKTSHLFMLSEPANVRAFGLDLKGRICSARAEFKVSIPLARDNCNCRAIGRGKNSILLSFLRIVFDV